MKQFDFKANKPTRKASKPSEPKITNPHIIDTRSDNPKRTKRKKKVLVTDTAPTVKAKDLKQDNITTLTTKISENYEGRVDGIIAYIDSLPQHIKTFIQTNQIKTTLARQGYSMYVLEHGFTLKITDVRINGKPKLNVVLKQGKTHIFNKTL